MTIRTMTMALATAGLLGGGAALAQPMMHHGMHGDAMEILHSVGLTTAQEAQVHTIMKATFAQQKGVMAQMEDIHQQIEAKVFGTAAVTQEDLAPLMQQEEQLRDRLDAAHLSIGLQIRALLTPEQLAKAASTQQQLVALHTQEKAVVGDSDEH